MARRASWIAFALACSIASLTALAADSQPAAVLPASPERKTAIRTPDVPSTPRINGPRIFGARPGHPFFYHIPVTGERPLAYAAEGLPAGLTIDPATGNITGRTTAAGNHAVTLTATNAKGKASTTFTIAIGNAICLTPPMGWNSWNFFASRVTAENVKGAADAMVNSGLIDHGWTYINIDDAWEGPERDPLGRITTNQKFPDMKALADYIHAKGLKFGIYSSPGPRTCANFLGTSQHEDQDAQSYAEWGVDYVKYDWCSYSGIQSTLATERYATLMSPEDADAYKQATRQLAAIPRGRNRTPEQVAQSQSLTTQINALTAKMDPDKKKQIDREIYQLPYKVFRASLNKVDRDIVYSLCQYGMGNVWEWGADPDIGGNLWRTTGDIQATWTSVQNIGFRQDDMGAQREGLARYAGPGHWNDPDMLEVGNGRLTPDENYTHMTLWCMLSAPLLIGCDMTKMDEFTVSLFTNDEVLAVNQDALGKQGCRVKREEGREVWIKPLADGTWAIALFNRTNEKTTVAVTWEELKVAGPQPVRDLWRQKALSMDNAAGLSAEVNPHGAELYRVGAPKP